MTANLAISLDGFTAGPDQSLEQPFGTGAEALTTWMFETDRVGREGLETSWPASTPAPVRTSWAGRCSA